MAMSDTDKTRERSIHRTFRHEDGSETARSSKSVVGLVFKYSDGPATDFDLVAAFGGKLPPPSVGRAASGFGISTSAGNAGNTVDTEGLTGPDKAQRIREAVESRLEVFVPEDGSEGEWSAERGVGTRPSLLLEAVRQYRLANNKPVDEAAMAEYRQLFKTDEGAEKRWMASSGFRAVFEQVKASKAAARAAEYAEKAKGAAKSDELLQ